MNLPAVARTRTYPVSIARGAFVPTSFQGAVNGSVFFAGSSVRYDRFFAGVFGDFVRFSFYSPDGSSGLVEEVGPGRSRDDYREGRCRCRRLDCRCSILGVCGLLRQWGEVRRVRVPVLGPRGRLQFEEPSADADPPVTFSARAASRAAPSGRGAGSRPDRTRPTPSTRRPRRSLLRRGAPEGSA